MGRPPIHIVPEDPRPLVREYVERCARRRKPADVQGLAKFVKVPATRLAQVLRERFDATTRELIWREQVELAKVILAEEPWLPLKEVAARSGVWGVRNLNRIFQRVEGVAPGALRGDPV
jgi:methylphosphotriester-DNA--protein-cysteine methyltransferase